MLNFLKTPTVTPEIIIFKILNIAINYTILKTFFENYKKKISYITL